jgi:eukaryotic translation initiation factor 2C
VSGSPEASCRTLQPVKRPDEGATNPWKTVNLQVNHFLVKFSPGTTILQYNVDIKPVRGRRMRIPQYALSTIRNKLCSDPPLGFPMPLTVDVAARQIFSATPLPTADFVMDFSDEEDMQFRSYKVTIKLARELKLSDLDDYISGRLMSIPHDVFIGVNQVMRENPRRHMISCGARFFEREPRVNDDLGRGITASRGFCATVKATSQGLAMCVDSTILAFRKPMSVIDFLGQLIDGFDIKSFQRFKMKVNATLKGLKVYVTHRASKREYIIRGLTKEKPKDILLTVGDPPRKISILQYFWEKHGKEVVHKDIPCLDLGKRNSVPMEFCELVYGQRYDKAHLNEHVVTALMEVSVAPPKMRRDNICTFVCSGDGPLGYANMKFIVF